MPRASCPGCSGGGEDKEGELAIRLWNLNICIESVDTKCWLAEMTLVITLLPLGTCTFQLVSASHWLAKNWQLSRRGEPQENWMWNSKSRFVVGSPSFLFFPLPERLGELVRRLVMDLHLLAADWSILWWFIDFISWCLSANQIRGKTVRSKLQTRSLS